MREILTQLRTESFVMERTWTVDDLPVLQARITLPQPVGTSRIHRRINRYYQTQGRAFLRYCQRFLLPEATRRHQLALEAGSIPPCETAQLDYHITYNDAGLWSLYTQSREIDEGGRPLLIRRGDTWDLQIGCPVPLSSFFPPHFPCKRRLSAFAAEEVDRRQRCGVLQPLDGWRRKLRRRFNSRNFYLTEGGLAFFYPMYAIAPGPAGIPVFTLARGQGSLLVPPSADRQEKPPLSDGSGG